VESEFKVDKLLLGLETIQKGNGIVAASCSEFGLFIIIAIYLPAIVFYTKVMLNVVEFIKTERN
jgi:hypothetical protein